MSLIKPSLKESLDHLIRNRYKIPDEFWSKPNNFRYRMIWLLDRTISNESYEWTAERLGITDGGDIIYGFDSGCSCNSAWDSEDENQFNKLEWKQFIITPKTEQEKKAYDEFIEDWNSFSEDWDKVTMDNVNDYMFLVQDQSSDKPITAKDIFKITNVEIRRYVITRLGYENIKRDLGATVIDTDEKGNELFVVVYPDPNNQPHQHDKIYQHFVKLNDSSSDREYILAVPRSYFRPPDSSYSYTRTPDMRTVREAVAWTFGLLPEQYNPEIET